MSTKTVAKNSVLYIIVQFLQKGIGFFLLPVYTSFLTPEDYGITAIVNSVVALMAYVYIVGYAPMTRFYYTYEQDPQALKKFWGTFFMVAMLFNTILCVSVILAHRIILDPFLGSIPFYPYMFLGVLILFSNAAFTIYQGTLQARQNGKAYALQNAAYFVLFVSLNILFITVLKKGAQGVLTATLIVSGVFFIYTLIRFPKEISFVIDRSYLKKGLAYSLPLFPHMLSGWLYTAVDRILLNSYRSTSDVGIYTVGMQFGLIISLIAVAVNQAYAPWFIQKIEQDNTPESKHEITELSRFLVMVYAVCAITVSLFAPEVMHIMARKNYYDAWKVVPYLAFGFVFSGVYYVVCNSLFIKKTHILAVISMTGAALSLGINFVFIPKFGMMGAAWASVSAQLVVSVITMIASMKAEPIRYHWGAMYGFVGTAFLTAVAVLHYGAQLSFIIALIIKLVVVALFIMLAFRLNSSITARIRGYLQHKLAPNKKMPA